MKICFLIYNYNRSGGSERVTSLIANHFSSSGHEVHILSICGDNGKFYHTDDRIILHTLFHYPISYKKHYFKVVKSIYKYYKNNQIDISIDVFVSISLFTIPFKRINNNKIISWEHFNSFTKVGMNSLARRLAIIFSDSIVVLTQEDLFEYKRRWPFAKANIKCIYNPTPFESARKSDLKHKTVISVGRLTYQKGYDSLLDIWSEVERRNSEWQLLIYGIGEDEGKLHNIIETLKLRRVKLMGETTNISDCYLNASIFVSTSRFEGLPMCMIEAVSHGLPIVSFDCKTGPKDIVKNGETGFVIPREDHKEFVEKLVLLMNSYELREEFSRNININPFKKEIIEAEWDMMISELGEK